MIKGFTYINKLKMNRIPIFFKHHVNEVSGKNPSTIKISPILDGGKLDTKKNIKALFRIFRKYLSEQRNYIQIRN